MTAPTRGSLVRAGFLDADRSGRCLEDLGDWVTDEVVALLAAAPAVEGVVYTPGMSIDLGAPLSSSSICTGVVVTESPVSGVSDVEVLQIVAATPAELAWCRVRGSAALLERWAAADTDLLDLARRGVALD